MPRKIEAANCPPLAGSAELIPLTFANCPVASTNSPPAKAPGLILNNHLKAPLSSSFSPPRQTTVEKLTAAEFANAQIIL